MKFSFPYIDEKGYKRPKIPIIINYKGSRIETLGLLDSGSDLTIFPKDVAEALGMNLSGNKTEIKGIGGSIESITENVSITVDNRKEKVTIPSMNVRVSTSKDSPIRDILIGRMPFFEYFDIEFKENAKRVIMKKIRK